MTSLSAIRLRNLCAEATAFARELYHSRDIVGQLAVQDFRSRFLGSYLGFTWAFLHPLVTILILWFVFEHGFRSRPIQDVPFILWLTAGLVPWFFVSDALSATTTSVLESAFLVKKVRFRVGLLPLIKLTTSLAMHLTFVTLVVLMSLIYGQPAGAALIQLPYYIVCGAVLLAGVGWWTSSMVVFVRDLQPAVAMVLQFGFWLTPIFWMPEMIPAPYRFLVTLNPVHYIVSGYRDAILGGVWFWERPLSTLYFWGLTSLVTLTGALVFRRLRPMFADVI